MDRDRRRDGRSRDRGACAVALAAPTGFAISLPVTNAAPAPQLGRRRQRRVRLRRSAATGACAGPRASRPGGGTGLAATRLRRHDGGADGTYCYQVVGHYPAVPDAHRAPRLRCSTTPPRRASRSPRPLAARRARPSSGSVTAPRPRRTVGPPVVAATVDRRSTGLRSQRETGAGQGWDTTGVSDVNGILLDARAATRRRRQQFAAVASRHGRKQPAAGAPSSRRRRRSPAARRSSGRQAGRDVHDLAQRRARREPPSRPWTDPATLAPGTYLYVVTATERPPITRRRRRT